MSIQHVIDIPNYNFYFSLVDKGFNLYYFHCYTAHKVTTRLQVITALSYGIKLFPESYLEEWQIEKAEGFNL